MNRHLVRSGLIGAGLALTATFARADCLDDAAAYFSVDPVLVRAIAQHESGMRANAINRNRNGSYDIGLMQINSSWLPRLATKGISEQSLFDPCVNGYVGTWILRANIERLGPTWKAVGAYNAVSPDKQLRYANRIYGRWRALQRAGVSQPSESVQQP